MRAAKDLQSRDNLFPASSRPMEYYMPMARQEVLKNYNIQYRPVDRRDNYVKDA